MLSDKKKQDLLIKELEMTLASMVNQEAPEKYIKSWGYVLELLQKGYSVVAVLEAEGLGLDKKVVSGIRKVFDVRWMAAPFLCLLFF